MLRSLVGSEMCIRDSLHMVSYYDHASGTVPRPRILLNKHTDDAHDNPTPVSYTHLTLPTIYSV